MGTVKETGEKRKVGDGTPGPGRPKGVPNKTTTVLKEAILQAATEAGGEDGMIGYLKTQAIANPQSFLPLLGKVLPLDLNATVQKVPSYTVDDFIVPPRTGE